MELEEGGGAEEQYCVNSSPFLLSLLIPPPLPLSLSPLFLPFYFSSFSFFPLLLPSSPSLSSSPLFLLSSSSSSSSPLLLPPPASYHSSLFASRSPLVEGEGVEGYRVSQVLTILQNLSFEEDSQQFLAQHTGVRR